MAISENDRRDAYLSRIQVPALDVDGFAAMLRRRAAFIGAVAAICAAISLAWILLSAPKYVASGQLVLDLPAQAAAGQPVSPDTVRVGMDNQISALTSRSVLERVVAKEKLDTDPLFGGRSKGILFALLAGVGVAPPAEPHSMALRQLNRAVSTARNPDSNAVTVKVVTPDRETSVRIANAVMDSYVEQERVGVEATPGNVAPLGARLETLQTRLRDAEQRYERYRNDNQAMVAAGQSGAEKQVSEIAEQVAAAEAKVNGLRSTVNQLQRARKILDGGGIPDAIRGGAIGTFRSRYVAARRLEIDLSETLGPRHPDRVIARLQAAEARRLLEGEIQDVAQSVTADLERARATVTQLKNRLEASKQNLSKTHDASARLKELERDVEANRAAYQAILARSQQVRPDNTSPRILSRATASPESGRTFPIGVLFVSVLLGLGLGVSLAWVLELADKQNETAALG